MFFFLNLNVVFTTNFLKVAQIRVGFSPGFPPGAGFPGEEFASACLYCRTPDELLARANFPWRLLQWVQSGEECSGVLLVPRWSNLLRENPRGQLWWDCSPGNLLLEESWDKAHTDWHHFKKVLYENDLKIKSKPNPENFTLRIYTMKLSAGLLNLVRLSL
jgi:hypothetical protein